MATEATQKEKRLTALRKQNEGMIELTGDPIRHGSCSRLPAARAGIPTPVYDKQLYYTFWEMLF
jgi:hypothetical protein